MDFDSLPKALELTFDDATNEISLELFEHTAFADEPIALSLKYEYHPECGFAPIREVTKDRNERIKQHYWKLWGLEDDKNAGQGMSSLKSDMVFEGEQVTINADDIDHFCKIVGNQQESYKGKDSSWQVPMDFAIKLGWKSIMKSIFPSSIDGDLLRLVHLSNGFKYMPGAPALKVGNVVTSDSQIVSVTNSDSGKTVSVRGTVYLIADSKRTPVIEVESSFLYRGKFEDYNATFDRHNDTFYSLTIKSEQDVAVLESKEWFEVLDEETNLKVGNVLIFRTESEYKYKTKDVYASVSCHGNVTFASQEVRGGKLPPAVAQVNYSSGGPVRGNPVLEYLKRNGTPIDQPSLFDAPYTLTQANEPCTIVTPDSNLAYSNISGDVNPIHVNPYFSDYAGLPGTITHGMWSSAATRRYVEQVAAENRPERVVSYKANFVGMILPRSTLHVVLRHVGQINGNKVIEVATYNSESGEKVLVGTAEVAQATTAYVFTGQGSQEQGMGMELYGTSPVAKRVWDQADEHLGDVYGFSIIDIVKNNPQELTVHFGGLKGQTIRKRYMDLFYHTADKDGNIRELPLFPDIDLRSTRYTFSSPTGLLFATQFAQIALVVTEKAAFEDMRARGLIQENCPFAGHSLGEYSALASIADVLPISALVDVVFYRGITMQRAVERDAQNRSSYGMCAINPSRIGKTFGETALREVVDTVSRKTDTLLEIVNFNVDGQQYVAAGELVALHCLTNVLNYMKMQKIDLGKLMETMTVEEVKEKLAEIVEETWKTSKALQEKEGWIKLERGFATIPLPGIDVPFHSRYLWAGVMPFRNYLSKKINPADLRPSLLEGHYIPNLIAEPFEVSKRYAQKIYDQTMSPKLEKVLKNWDSEKWGSNAQRTKLAYTILVELLAYQFASPVRWIETQNKLFSDFKTERLIELGPSPTLAGMATRTLKLRYEALDSSTGMKREIYNVAKNTKEIYYAFEDAEEAEAPIEAAPASSSAQAAPTPAPAPVAAAAPQASAGPAVSVPDEPLKAVDTLRVIIAQKLKKSVADVPLTKAIKDLVGGKSTLQNEILGDLQAEFTSAPDKGEEMALGELGAALNVGYSGTLGKYTNGLVSRAVGSKLPGGFGLSAAKGHLSKQWGLGPGRTDGALLVALTMEPAKRLGSEGDAKTWLDSVAQAYAQQAGISLASASQAAGGGGAAGGMVIDSEALDALENKQKDLASQQVETLMRFLGRDSRDGHRLRDVQKEETAALQEKIDAIKLEHGDDYLDGIQPVFDHRKARHFNSAFNWVRQDALCMFYDIIFGRLTTVDRDITARCLVIMNRADPVLLDYMRYRLDHVPIEKGETYRLAKEFGNMLLQNCEESSGTAPLYKDVTIPTAPKTTVSPSGELLYAEVARPKITRLEKYVAEMAAGSSVTPNLNLERVHDSVSDLYKLVKAQPSISKSHMAAIKALYGEVAKTLGKTSGTAMPTGSASRSRRPSSQFLRPTKIAEPTQVAEDKVPLLHLRRKVGSEFQYSSRLTSLYLDVLKEIATTGTTFAGKNALLTGVGRGSIGVEILKGLLAGGAKVIITTSRYSRSVVEYYQGIYQEVGSRGSSLTVVPFNGGSRQDIEAIVQYIYSTEAGSGLDMDLDYILPFAALPENGRQIDGIDDRSELAHRIMLTNLLRLLGAVKAKKASRRFITRPTQVILPLSPNHGLFGNDGLYSESKISLETLFNRWASESWGSYLCLAGAVIGWTRGTGLMSATNTVAEGIEAQGCRTFSAKEMAFNILGLMHPLLFDVCQIEPVWADFNGGMGALTDLHILSTKNVSATRRAITQDNARDFAVTNGSESETMHKKVEVTARANMAIELPQIKSYETLSATEMAKLRGVIDLEKVIVVTGFAEVGPFGSARTRWQMEAKGTLNIEGLLELAIITGLIQHFDGRLASSGKQYVGWIDVKTKEPVDETDVRTKYEKHILEHTGVRLIEPELFRGYDPNRKGFTQEVELNHDLEAIETSTSEASKFKLEHGESVDIWQDGDRIFAKFKKGAKIHISKAVKFDRLVAGQIPTGWDARVYGIPEDIINQTDRTALWALVCVAEALMMSGITDPYELFKYVHPSEVGTALGSGMGGMVSLSKMFRDRRQDLDVQKDILQETFINTVAGWVNLLLLSASGPVKIPVGACATALQSIEIACDSILSGKAKVMIAGGFDDFSEEGSYEFANMKATSNTETELASGREPTEMSRPTTSTRAGFMESQGCGAQILMSAATAIEMGATICGIVGYTATATDKAGRSVPAPGKGVLSTARQINGSKAADKILDLDYRRRQIEFRFKQISEWLNNEIELFKLDEPSMSAEAVSEQLSSIRVEAKRQQSSVLSTYGMLDGAHPNIAPLRRSLAVWGLDIDDIGVASFHGTSTNANDKNESAVFNKQFEHLGRSKGNACPVIAQKWLTGHPKGGAAAWMMNGMTQSLLSGLIPGNRNCDNLSPEMQAFELLVYPSHSIQTDGLKAGLLKSFGFGQVGGEALVIHPDYLLASLDANTHATYVKNNGPRAQNIYRKFNDAFVSRNLIQLKELPPYAPELEQPVLLNPLARAAPDAKAGSYTFTAKGLPKSVPLAQGVAEAASKITAKAANVFAVGTDVELIAAVPHQNENFLARNFTTAELDYCKQSSDFSASLAGRWSAKEAVFKSLRTTSRGAAAAMKDIEIVSEGGMPTVRLAGDAAQVAQSQGISDFELSISHADGVAISVCVSKK